MSEIKAVLAQVGSCRLTASVEPGRLELTMSSDLTFNKQIGLTLMFEDLVLFSETMRHVLTVSKAKVKR